MRQLIHRTDERRSVMILATGPNPFKHLLVEFTREIRVNSNEQN